MSVAPVSCSDVVLAAVDLDVPILLLDTCFLLDVIRVPMRQHLDRHHAGAMRNLLEAAQAVQPRSLFVVCQQVAKEYAEYADAVANETNTFLNNEAESHRALVDRINALAGASVVGAADIDNPSLPDIGRNIAADIFRAAIVVSEESTDGERALTRTRECRPPSSRGKNSIEDCVITETYLRVAQALSHSTFDRNVVFASSNTRDFQQGQSSLHSRLRQEFDAVGLGFASSWAAAKQELHRP